MPMRNASPQSSNAPKKVEWSCMVVVDDERGVSFSAKAKHVLHCALASPGFRYAQQLKKYRID